MCVCLLLFFCTFLEVNSIRPLLFSMHLKPHTSIQPHVRHLIALRNIFEFWKIVFFSLIYVEVSFSLISITDSKSFPIDFFFLVLLGLTVCRKICFLSFFHETQTLSSSPFFLLFWPMKYCHVLDPSEFDPVNQILTKTSFSVFFLFYFNLKKIVSATVASTFYCSQLTLFP